MCANLHHFVCAHRRRIAAHPHQALELIVGVPQCAGPVLQFVFIWSALQLPARKWKYVFIALSILSTCGAVLGSWLSTATPLVFGLMGVSAIGAVIRDAGMCAFLVWAIFRRPSNRLLAFLLLLPPLFSLLGVIGDVTGLSWLSFRSFQFFQITLLIALYAIAALLARRGWKSWLANNELRVEMQAAREVQQQLVPAALPVIAGFKAHAAYIPAAEVGGDFYQILMQPDDTTLIVVGDVSGKGLKAAMKGALAIGAIRAIAAETSCPGELLRRLNLELHRARDGGFMTCICGLISSSGAAVLANAGHLAPYRNGEEVEISNDLPLGLTSEADYAETHLQLSHGDILTFLSDGVIEARNSLGDLFGFERTQAISTQSAHSIAAAAQQFGQEDDITVLTLTFTQP